MIDVVIEILDARIPVSSQNPDVLKLTKDKKKIIILNKADLAEEAENKKWIQYFQKRGIKVILCNSLNGYGINKIENEIENVMKDEKEKAINKGRINRAVHVMVLGIPNVGKSSFINRISNKASMQVGNKPGVTKQKQWIRLSNNIELLDTPGVLWPKLNSEKTSLNLAFTGTIKNEILEETEIAYNLIKFLINDYKKNISETYKIEEENINEITNNNNYEGNEKIIQIMELIGKSRGAIIKGGNIDLDRTSKIILDDFKNGRLGKITLEKVEK